MEIIVFLAAAPLPLPLSDNKFVAVHSCRQSSVTNALAPATGQSMAESSPDQIARNADRLLLGAKHPVFAIFAFMSAFVFAALPFLVNTENALIIVPCLIACASCSILFIQLLIGRLGHVKWLLLAIAGFLCVYAGGHWYLIVLLTGGTVLCCSVVDRLIGRFRPLIRVSDHEHAWSSRDNRSQQRDHNRG